MEVRKWRLWASQEGWDKASHRIDLSPALCGVGIRPGTMHSPPESTALILRRSEWLLLFTDLCRSDKAQVRWDTQ